MDLRVLFSPCCGSGDTAPTSALVDGSPAIVHFFGGDTNEASGQLASPRGAAFDDTANELFVSDQLSHCVNVYTFSPDAPNRAAPSASKSKPNRPRTRAVVAFSRTFGAKGHGRGELQQPSGLDISHYHVVVCDVGNHRLAVFTKRGSFVTSIGRKGTGDGEFHDIRDVKLLHVRKVADAMTLAVRGPSRADQADWCVCVCCGTVAQRAISRGLSLNEDTVANEQFEIVVADPGNFRIQVLNESGEFLRQLSLLSNSQHTAFQRGKLNALETLLLREYAALGDVAVNGKLETPPSLSGSAMTQLYKLVERLHPSCPAYARITAAQSQLRETRSHFHHPLSIAYAPARRELVLVDCVNSKVMICNADGSRTNWLRLAQREEVAPRVSSVHSALQLSVECKEGDHTATIKHDRLYVSDPQSHRIAVFEAATLQFLYYIGATTYGYQTLCSSGYLPGEIRHPTFLATFTQVDSDTGTRTHILAVSDSGNHAISLFDAWTGAFCGRIGEGFGHLEAYFDSPHGVAVFDNRLLYVCDQRNHRIQVFDLANHSFVRAFGREGRAVGEFSFPAGVGVSSALPSGDPTCNFGPHREAKVVVGDTGNNRVQIFAIADSQVLMVLSVDATPLDQPLVPTGVFVEPRSGAVLVCDAANKRVVIFRRGGEFLASFGSTVEPANRFDRPISAVKSSCGRQLLVVDAGRCDVCVFELRSD